MTTKKSCWNVSLWDLQYHRLLQYIGVYVPRAVNTCRIQCRNVGFTVQGPINGLTLSHMVNMITRTYPTLPTQN
jgi:hypothetical protein